MSILMMTKVRNIDVGTIDKMILEALADQMNDDGYGQVSISDINRRVGITERGSLNIYKRLVDAGHLVIEKSGKKALIQIKIKEDDIE